MRRVFVVAVATIASSWLASAASDVVRIDGGQLRGTSAGGVRVFKGIPFAAPPVGALRWKAPQPAIAWSGVKAADTFGAQCMQPPYPAGSPYASAPQPTSEDCLYLNVWTAARGNDRRPVMVWIHGGAWTRGSGSTPTYDGAALAKKGVVVVTTNYRLRAFGFFAHPELTKESPTHGSGNYGILDHLAALKWVQKNIAAFGGDPARVTIFGESAGSWSVNNLVATPLAKGLFQRAIGESGGQFSITRTLTEAEQAGAKFAEANGAASLSALRAMPAATLNGANGFQTSATVDGWVFPQDVMTIFKNGKQNDVPVIIGSNANEGSIFTPETVTGESFKQQTERQYGPDAETVLKLYPFTSDQEARA